MVMPEQYKCYPKPYDVFMAALGAFEARDPKAVYEIISGARARLYNFTKVHRDGLNIMFLWAKSDLEDKTACAMSWLDSVQRAVLEERRD